MDVGIPESSGRVALGAVDGTLIETHLAWVSVGAHDVWKVQKPLTRNGFDRTSLTARREACEDEVYRNRALAENVYLGFVPITVDPRDRPRLGGPGKAVEWAVHMRRLAPDRAADRLLVEDRLERRDLARVATRLAAFHETSSIADAPHGAGSRTVLARNVRRFATWARPAIGRVIQAAELDRIESGLLRYLERHRARFDARLAAGCVRDIHGDVRLDHVHIDRRTIAIVDRLELDPIVRTMDVTADLATFSLGLETCGRLGLATAFLDAYRKASKDEDCESVLHFYQAYCAMLRACLLVSLALDMSASAQTRACATHGVRHHVLLALAVDLD